MFTLTVYLQKSSQGVMNVLCHVRQFMEIGSVTTIAQVITIMEDSVMLQEVENYRNVVATTILISFC